MKKILSGMSGTELRIFREMASWTQEQLAEALGVRGNTVARWEQGKKGISEPIARLVRYVVLDSIKNNGVLVEAGLSTRQLRAMRAKRGK